MVSKIFDEELLGESLLAFPREISKPIFLGGSGASQFSLGMSPNLGGPREVTEHAASSHRPYFSINPNKMVCKKFCKNLWGTHWHVLISVIYTSTL